MAIKRPEVSSGTGGSQGSVTEGILPKKCPLLLEMLSECKYDDGSTRQTSTLLLFVEGGMVKACLNDRDLGRTAWAVGTTLENVLAALEGRLEKGTTEWRPGGGGAKQKPRGR